MIFRSHEQTHRKHNTYFPYEISLSVFSIAADIQNDSRAVFSKKSVKFVKIIYETISVIDPDKIYF